ncbi:hypothetical protein [Thaumasiovibrio subtropicus]|uniref:hypothetical protein n=1 Tax=Thaumasiovibrio subtropicus TaxID=1891207 RepID=UPI000B34F421|nr:hypothetical protein [Thaumasiovibrio subtropicus]
MRRKGLAVGILCVGIVAGGMTEAKLAQASESPFVVLKKTATAHYTALIEAPNADPHLVKEAELHLLAAMAWLGLSESSLVIGGTVK